MLSTSKGAELAYFKGLVDGSNLNGCPHRRTIPLNRLIRNYITSAKRRQQWGTYVEEPGGSQIISYAEAELARIETIGID